MAVDQKGRKVGIGVVIRDDEGGVLVAMGGQRSNAVHPAVAKSYALWKVMKVCRDLNFSNVIFEGGAQVIVDVVNEVQEDLTFYGSVIEDVKKLLKERNRWSVKFVYRNSNKAARVSKGSFIFTA